jgi:hypothetical protein
MSVHTRSTTGGPARRRDRAGHKHAAAAARRERAQHRSEEKEGRRQIIDLLRRHAGVTHILATIATENDTAEDVVRRARLLHAVLTEITEGALTLPGVKPQNALRSLAFLDGEIAWLENAASGSRTRGAT